MLFQLHNKYIVSQIKSGLIIIDQQGAHERILYEKALDRLKNNVGSTQQELFPKTLKLSPTDFELVKELASEIQALGFDIQEEKDNSFTINGIPAEAIKFDSAVLLEGMIEKYKQNLQYLQLDKTESIARSIAFNTAIKAGKHLSIAEMSNLIDELFACEMPYSNPSGNPTITNFSINELDEKFNKN
jgi:DNA mismatch repair protein MutL